MALPFTRSRPPPPRLLLINKFAESRAPELESLHSILSARLNHDFRMRRDKRRRTTAFQSGKKHRRKRPCRADATIASAGDVDSDGEKGDSKKNKASRRIRRRLDFQRNPSFGFCASGDGTKRLRTHLWHAKRFSMVKQWGFYLPLGLHGKGRGSRAILKWLKSGAFVHDASYCHPVQLEGPEESIMDIMRMVLRPFPQDFSEQASLPVLYGTCYAHSMLYDVRSLLPKFIAPVIYMWLPQKRDENFMNSELVNCSSSTQSYCGTSSRKLWLWLHPASYSEGFDSLSCTCLKQINESGANVRCLSLEGHIARFEVIGNNSLSILQKILIPMPENSKNDTLSQSSGSFLRVCSNTELQSNFILEHADCLPSHAIVSIEVQDPRDLPVKETKLSTTTASLHCNQSPAYDSNANLIEESIKNRDLMLSFWSKPEENGIFLSRCKHLWDSYADLKPPLPENVLCMEKNHKRLKRFYLDTTNSGELNIKTREGCDLSCPIMLLRHADHEAFNSGWSIILPLSWVKPFWMSLISNRARAIGLREKQWIACNGGLPSFPYDFPDSIAYSAMMNAEVVKADDATKLRPPAVMPINVPVTPQWDCVACTLQQGFYTDKSYCAGKETARDSSFGIEPQENKQFSCEHVESFEVSVLRTLNELSCLENTRGPFFVRVLIHAFKEGSFEAAAVVCAPTLTDLPAWKSRWEEHAQLQVPDSFVKSYFTRQDLNKWEFNVPQDTSMLQWHRWPIGFITSGFVHGSSSKPTAIAFCEARILKVLREQQDRVMGSAGPEIFLLIRNLKSSTYRRAIATVFLDRQDEDLGFM